MLRFACRPVGGGRSTLRPTPFLPYSALGAAALWTALYLGAGLVFRDQIDRGPLLFQQYGAAAMVVLAVALAAYLSVRWWRRRRSATASG
jgi:membrane protein DedA with SNARE-associated domain